MDGSMFAYDKLQDLNGLETDVYAYIMKNRDKVEKMTIRELAKEAHVSTTTILRFATKMGYEGFAELRFALKQDRLNQEQQGHPDSFDITVPLADFFHKVNTTDFEDLLDKAVDWIADADMILTFGIGTSGFLAEYGARFISNMGKLVLPIIDPFQPMPTDKKLFANIVVLVLSVSGESREVLDMVAKLQRTDAKVIAVTNHTNSTLAHLSDLTIAYYMPEVTNGTLNMTTQVPVVYLLELMGHRLDQRVNGHQQDTQEKPEA